MTPQEFLDDIRHDQFEIANDPEVGGLRVPALARALLSRLEEGGHFPDAHLADYRYERGNVAAEVHAYAYDTEDDTVYLFFVIDANESVRMGDPAAVASVGKDQIDRAFRRLEAFKRLAQDGPLPTVDLSNPAGELGELLRNAKEEGQTIVTQVLATGSVSKRAADTGVWDIDRLSRNVGGGNDDRPAIDFSAEYGGALPCLVTPATEEGLQVLLTWVSGDVLAKIYNTYRSRLLERNVRSFLQFTGKVNKGIRETIIERPTRFLPYNNGLSATASSADLVSGGPGLGHIRAVKDFQVVNGGQTTASIASSFRRDKVDVSAVAVAMKLTIVPEEKVDTLVPLISRYANTQNRIQEADFSANHPWHIALERESRRIWTSPNAANAPNTRWFYERSRGQYADALGAEKTPAGRKQFRAQNPTVQKFTKTDVAKYVLSWEQHPAHVSRGAQKCFAELMNRIHREQRPAPDGSGFKRLACLAILFHTAEELHGELGYKGYRAQVVTYTIARLSLAFSTRLPWEQIWKDQRLPDAVVRPLGKIMVGVREVVTRPPKGGNVTEWSKSETCWDVVRQTRIAIGQGGMSAWQPYVQTGFIAPVDPIIAAVVQVPTTVWAALGEWGKAGALTASQRGLARVLTRTSAERPPTANQAAYAKAMILLAVRRGFAHRALTADMVTAFRDAARES